AIPQAPRDREIPLSFAQARLWFLDRVRPGSAVYNVPVAWRLRGRLEPAALAAALTEIVRRHEALRTRFADGAEGPVQVIDPAALPLAGAAGAVRRLRGLAAGATGRRGDGGRARLVARAACRSPAPAGAAGRPAAAGGPDLPGRRRAGPPRRGALHGPARPRP